MWIFEGFGNLASNGATSDCLASLSGILWSAMVYLSVSSCAVARVPLKCRWRASSSLNAVIDSSAKERLTSWDCARSPHPSTNPADFATAAEEP